MNIPDELCKEDSSSGNVVGDLLLLKADVHDDKRNNFESLCNDESDQSIQVKSHVFSIPLHNPNYPIENNCTVVTHIVNATDEIESTVSMPNITYNLPLFSNYGLNTIGHDQPLVFLETTDYENTKATQHSVIEISTTVDSLSDSMNISYKDNQIILPSDANAAYKDLPKLHEDCESNKKTVIYAIDNNKVVIVQAEPVNEDLNGIRLEKKIRKDVGTSNEHLFIEHNFDVDIISTDDHSTLLQNNCNSSGADIYEIPAINCKKICSECKYAISKATEKNLSWQAMEFCDTHCLLRYQKTLGEKCTSCSVNVNTKLTGQYIVRLGKNICQFCSITCLSRYTKNRIKCVYCYSDAVAGGYCANDKNFCSLKCINNAKLAKTINHLEQASSICSVCFMRNTITIQYIKKYHPVKMICRENCFAYFRSVSNVRPQKCSMCSKYSDIAIMKKHILFNNDVAEIFCSNHCKVLYIISQHTLHACRGCKAEKGTYEMIQRYNGMNIERWCSIECLKPSTTQLKISTSPCGACFKSKRPTYVAIMSDSASRFNSSTSAPNKTNPLLAKLHKSSQVSKSVQVTTNSLPKHATDNSALAQRSPSEIVQALQKHRELVNNKSTMCELPTTSIGTNHNVVETKDRETQTRSPNSIVPVSKPYPVFEPVPFLAPVFVPIPQIVCDSIMNSAKETNDDIPSDSAEADVLLMASMISSFATNSEARDKQSTSGWDKESTVDIVYSNKPDINNIDYDVEVILETTTISCMTVNTEIEQPKAKERKTGSSLRGNTEQQNSKKRKRKSEWHDKKLADMLLKYEYGVDKLNRFMRTKIPTWQYSKACLNYDEFCQALCMFITEIRKPNMEKYAPDTILYLCMGIQYYLSQHGRTENIFFERTFAKFTDMLHQILGSFSGFHSESQFIVTRIEEEHLWESKLLGSHSPLTLLNTLVYFNTKHLSLTTTGMHMQLAFSQILKHWKKLSPNSRRPVLHFYPKKGQSFKKVFYEQQEHESNPLRCPVNFYEFYLKHCPYSTRTRDDVFYLCPERYSVPESPVWYSTNGLSFDDVDKMLRRIRLVKEINVALFSQ